LAERLIVDLPNISTLYGPKINLPTPSPFIAYKFIVCLLSFTFIILSNQPTTDMNLVLPLGLCALDTLSILLKTKKTPPRAQPEISNHKVDPRGQASLNLTSEGLCALPRKSSLGDPIVFVLVL